MIKAICFDFDGVITESVDIKTEAFREIFKDESKENIQHILAYHKAHGGINRKLKFIHFYSQILKRELTDHHLNKLLVDFKQLVKEKVVAANFVKGSREFIENNYKKYIFYIVSGTPQDELMEIVQRKGLNKYFKKVCGFPPAKTELLSALIGTENLDKDTIVFIGDSMDDRLCAQHNAVKFVGRGIWQKDADGKTCYAVDDLSNLQEIINSI